MAQASTILTADKVGEDAYYIMDGDLRGSLVFSLLSGEYEKIFGDAMPMLRKHIDKYGGD